MPAPKPKPWTAEQLQDAYDHGRMNDVEGARKAGLLWQEAEQWDQEDLDAAHARNDYDAIAKAQTQGLLGKLWGPKGPQYGDSGWGDDTSHPMRP